MHISSRQELHSCKTTEIIRVIIITPVSATFTIIIGIYGS